MHNGKLILGAIFMLVIGMWTSDDAWVASSVVLSIMSWASEV